MSPPGVGLPASGPVVHPTDFDAGADAAFPYAVYVAALCEEAVHVLHVAAPGDARPADEAFPDPAEVRDRVSGWLEGRATDADGSGGGRDAPGLVREVRRSADPASEILDYASDVGAGAVCMGTHARRGLRRLVLGSVAERVVRRCGAPVLTVRRGIEGWAGGGPRSVLVGADLSEMTAPALAWAGAVAAATGSGLEALHVVESPAGAPPAGRRQRIHRAYREATDEDARPDAPLEVMTVAGEPVSRLCSYAEEEGVDLVVTGTHGRSGPARLVLGSVAEGVVRRAPCPVLTVSAPPGSGPGGASGVR